MSRIPSEYAKKISTIKKCDVSGCPGHKASYIAYIDVNKCPSAETENNTAVELVKKLIKKVDEELRQKCGEESLVIDNDVSLDKKIDELISIIKELKESLTEGITRINSEIDKTNEIVKKENAKLREGAKPSSECETQTA